MLQMPVLGLKVASVVARLPQQKSSLSETAPLKILMTRSLGAEPECRSVSTLR